MTMALSAPAARAAEAAAPTSGEDNLLSDVVVTATRQVDTVSRIPLSITAVTQRALDQQGIHDLVDLQRTVPSLTISDQAGTDLITIRGIGSQLGAATTGMFLDDTNLTKRGQAGVAPTNGSPAPPLFDLERVEVLRGPQGTLFGGSSEGGTVRFITPQASVTRYSGYALAQGSTTHHGAASYKGGFAIGGPIVQDKLGFRTAIFAARAGGWIDNIDPYTGKTYRVDSNRQNEESIRLQLLWKPTERLSVGWSVYASATHSSDTSAYTLPMASTTDIAASGLIPASVLALGWGGVSPLCIRYTGTAAVPLSTSAGTGVPCTTPGLTFIYPAHPWGPYNTKPYERVTEAPTATSPFLSELQTSALTFDYEFDHMSVKSITSWLADEEKRQTYDTSVVSSVFKGYPQQLFNDPCWNCNLGYGNFRPKNRRHGITQELRFASDPSAPHFSWVGGVYYALMNQAGQTVNWEDMERVGRVLTGLPAIARYGVAEQFEIQSRVLQWQRDVEIAAYGEVNIHVTDKLRAIAGIRVSRVTYNYYELLDGLTKVQYSPTVENGGIVQGGISASPVTPKFSLQYQMTDNDQVYVTAAKGFRPGGINSPLTVATCGPALAQFGLTVNDIPAGYDPDQVWSYEVGGKSRLFGNRLQVNVAVYDIEWSKLQTTLNVNSLGCGIPWVQNVGTARSRGVDFEASARLFKGFVLSAAISYDKAYYTSDALGPRPANGTAATVFAAKGQLLGVRPWNISANAQYNFNVMGKYDAYIRSDATYVPKYDVAQFGLTGYSPDSSFRNKTFLVNARFGVVIDKMDVNLFVNNLLESRDGTPTGGRSGCSAASGPACTVFTNYNPLFTLNTFRPREIGLQAAYRF
ncbi:MAG TPA: TonB-dependent receptor [Caulobacteraceae bacterium]|nr:TonB-dependent receptor [Caulobacteraceae bacterium]